MSSHPVVWYWVGGKHARAAAAFDDGDSVGALLDNDAIECCNRRLCVCQALADAIEWAPW